MNTIHSIDGYLLRSLIRRASFNPTKVSNARDLISKHLMTRAYGATNKGTLDVDLENMLNIYEYSKMLDVSLIDYITEENIGYVPMELLVKLNATLGKMLELGSSPVLTIHDAFKAHPNHCNAVRYWYKEILAELAESDILQFIVSQIVGKQVNYIKKSKNLGDLIRQSNYGIC